MDSPCSMDLSGFLAFRALREQLRLCYWSARSSQATNSKSKSLTLMFLKIENYEVMIMRQ